MDETGTAAPRLATIDAVRGLAVCGILIMNIVAIGMPGYAYVSPLYFGGARGADLIAWAAAYVIADGKLRALFTMLFGASMALIADRAEGSEPGPIATHYRRMAWLFLFGMIHAWFFWFGDILTLYALTGAIAFVAWKWPPSALAFGALVLIGCVFALDLLQWHDLSALKAAARAGAGDAMDAWRDIATAASPADPERARQLALYRGGFTDVFAARMPTTLLFQTMVLPESLPETLGFALFGLLLFRTGFLGGEWRRRYYWALIAIGYGIALPLYAPIVRMLIASGFDPVIMPLTDALSLLLRPWLALAYAASIILLVRSGKMRWLTLRLIAAGRMAFSNYLGTTIIATTIFYGYGFGLYGELSRARLYIVVAGIWAAILLWSPLWLDHFAYGPLEWLWRSLARGRLQPFRRKSIAKTIASCSQ